MDGIHSIKMLWVLYSPMAPTRIFEVERERDTFMEGATFNYSEGSCVRCDVVILNDNNNNN